MKKFLLLSAVALMSLAANAADYYVVGAGVNGKTWQLKAEDAKFTAQEDGTYVWEGTKLENQFKINDGTWSGWQLGSNGTELSLGVEYIGSNEGGSGNLTFAAGVTSVTNPKIVLNPAENTITVTGTADNTLPDLYLVGDMNGWEGGFIDDWKFVDENGVLTLKDKEVTAGQSFKVASKGWSEQYGGGTITTADTPVEIANGGANAVCNLTGIFTITFDRDTKSITFAGKPQPMPAPEELYIVGSVKGANWNTSKAVAMTKVGDSFKAEQVELEDDGDPTNNCYFSFCTIKADSWDGDDTTIGVNSGDRFGAAEENQPIVLAATTDLTVYKAGVNASACKAFEIEKGLYDITVSFKDVVPTVYIAKNSLSGVENVNVAEDGEAVYFNFQGVRVENPEKGMYIRVVNNKAEKVVL